MKVNVEYILPEDTEDFKLFTHANSLRDIIWNLNSYMRELIKYQSNTLPESNVEVVELIKDKLIEEMNNHNLSFDNNLFL